MSKIIEVFKDIKEAEREISIAQTKMDNAKKQIEKWLRDFRFKEFVDSKIYEGFTEEQKTELDKERIRRRNMLIAYNSAYDDKVCCQATYSNSIIFDPRTDAYSIYDIETRDDEMRLLIDPHKTRNYLGVAGGWIIDSYQTSWFKINEFNKVINNIDC